MYVYALLRVYLGFLLLLLLLLHPQSLQAAAAAVGSGAAFTAHAAVSAAAAAATAAQQEDHPTKRDRVSAGLTCNHCEKVIMSGRVSPSPAPRHVWHRAALEGVGRLAPSHARNTCSPVLP